jgi:NAD(P)-dependent dehydrogenase (short-subunit alcohol dehydrogenase family)
VKKPFHTAWIIGASSGIGRALARIMADDGTKVTVSARRKAELDDLKNELGPDKITVMPLNISDAEAARAAVETMSNKYQLPEVIVIAAAIYEQADADSLDTALFSKMMTINYLGPLNVLSALVPKMKTLGQGHIAIVSSVAGYRGLPLAAAYGPTKAAVTNLCESLCLQLRRHGIHLQVINPGFVDTPLTKKNNFAMPLMLTPENAARRLYQGLQSDRFEITFPRRFTWFMKLMRILPYGLYFALVSAITRGRRQGDEKRS